MGGLVADGWEGELVGSRGGLLGHSVVLWCCGVVALCCCVACCVAVLLCCCVFCAGSCVLCVCMCVLLFVC